MKISKTELRQIIKEEIKRLNEETYTDDFVLWANGVVGNLNKAIKKAKYIGKAGKGWDGSYKTNAKNGHGTVFFVSANNVKQAKERLKDEISEKDKLDTNIYSL